MINVKNIKKQTRKIISMSDMKPGQIGVINDESHSDDGCFVLRTFNRYNFEVMNLDDRYKWWWDKTNCNISVELFSPDEIVTLEISNN